MLLQQKCRVCAETKHLCCFSKSSRLKSGHQSICKPCDVKSAQAYHRRKKEGKLSGKDRSRESHEKRLALLNQQLVRSRSGQGQTRRKEESASLDFLESCLHGLEMRRWQDATRSDVGVRPTCFPYDSWLPLQIKSSMQVTKFTHSGGFHLRGSDRLLPNCDTIAIYMPTKEIMYIPQSRLGVLPIGGFLAFDARLIVTPSELVSILLGRFADTNSVYSEETLRFQVNEKYMVEMKSISYSNRLLPDTRVEWPDGTNGVTDLIRDGEREQYKSVQRNANGFCVRHCWKKMRNVQVAYETGDNDWYVFGYNAGICYLQWRIPAGYMTSIGMLSIRHEAEDRFVEAGRCTMQLSVVGEHGENMHAHMRVVGKAPRKDTDRSTAQFLKVLWL